MLPAAGTGTEPFLTSSGLRALRFFRSLPLFPWPRQAVLEVSVLSPVGSADCHHQGELLYHCWLLARATLRARRVRQVG